MSAFFEDQDQRNDHTGNDGTSTPPPDHHARGEELFGNLSSRVPGEDQFGSSPGAVARESGSVQERERSDPADKVAEEQEVPMSSASQGDGDDRPSQQRQDDQDAQAESEPQQAGPLPEQAGNLTRAPNSVSSMRGATQRPDNLNVHWKYGSRFGVPPHSPSQSQPQSRSHAQASAPSFTPHENGISPSTSRSAARLVRKHTGRPTAAPSPAHSGSDSDNDAGSSSAVSFSSDETASEAGPSRHTPARSHSRRRGSHTSDASSGGSSLWSEDEGEPSGRRGVLSELLSLYRSERAEEGGGVMRSLLNAREKSRNGEYPEDRRRRKRRWSESSLFAVNSRRRGSRGAESATSEEEGGHPHNATGGRGGEEAEGEELPQYTEKKKKVRRNRRNQEIPHRSQNPEEPYIPSPYYSNPMKPSPNVTIAQRFGQVMNYANPFHWVGRDSSSPVTPGDHKYRHIVALVITTSGLAGAATPALAHLAPAAGRGAETSKGERKLSWYEGENESTARGEDAERQEDEAMGMSGGERDDLEKAMEEGKLKKGRGSRWRVGRRRGKRKQKEMAVTRNIASILQRKKFIEMLAKSVVNYGAPSHSVEQWLESTADILQVEASFVYIPGILIVAFRDTDVHSTDILFIRPKGTLELYRLSLVHQVYRKVVHDEISASQGCRVLRRIHKQTVPYPRIFLVLVAAVASATSARVAFSGSFADMLMAGALGSLLAIVQFTVATRHRLISNVFEIGMAGILSFFARGLGSSHYFCYDSVASAAIVLILPGWHICLGALELGSKNVVAGVIRVVWAIVYTLFLSFGLSIGSQIWDTFGPAQLTAPTGGDGSTLSISGNFDSNNTQWDQTFRNGTFTFSNGTSEAMSTVTCYRNPDWNYWWYTELNAWWLFLLVPLFAISLAIWFHADFRSKDMVVMVLVACAGYAVEFFLSNQIEETNVTSAVAAFAVGLLGNLYSRLGKGSAFPSMVVGILLLVPNGIAAAGGLSASSTTTSSSSSGTGSSSGSGDEQSLNAAVIVSIRLVQVGVGLAIGLFAAALVVYPFGKKRRYIFSY